MTLRHSPLLLALALLAACDDKKAAPTEAPAPVAANAQGTAKPAAAPAAAPTPAANAAPAYKGATPSNDKPFLGLTLPPQGHWKPTFDQDAKVAKWEDDAYMTSIVIRVVDDKLDTIDDLKAAAPMMMQLGSAITKVTEEKKTDKGWYSIVSMEKDSTLVYVRKFGTTTVCSANLAKSAMGGKTILKDEALKACEAYSPKG